MGEVSWHSADFHSTFSVLAMRYGVELVRVPITVENNDLQRWLWREEWFREHEAEVDRVLFFDAADTFFQLDPFAELVDRDVVTFVAEGALLAGEWSNMGWAVMWSQALCRRGQQEFARWMSTTAEVVNSGLLGGGVAEVRKLMAYMIPYLHLVNAEMWADQGFLNIAITSGGVSRAGVRYRIDGCAEHALHMWCPFAYDPLGVGDFFDVVSHPVFGADAIQRNNRSRPRSRLLAPTAGRAPPGRVPSVFHQYNRFGDVRANYFARCGLAEVGT